MFKLKTSLLALSISASLLAPQVSIADPLQVLTLGDSITNGIYNRGNELAYRDDLHELLRNAGYDYEFVGKCPTHSSGDEGGECAVDSFYDPVPNLDSEGYVIPATSGEVLLHEGRAGWHASQLDLRIGSIVPSWYFPDAVFLHIGTNDIFKQENDAVKTDAHVEMATYNQTLTDIKSIVAKLKTANSSMKIYLAKLLPMGKIGLPDGTDIAYAGVGGDAARIMNILISNHNWGANVTLVDQNTGFNLVSGDDGYFQSDLIHPNQRAEAKMAENWFNKFKLDFAPTLFADPTKSTLSATTSPVTANNKDFATVTLQAKNSDGEDLTAGGANVQIYHPTLSTLSATTDNGDGTYSATLTRSVAGDVVMKAKINGVVVTDNTTVTFIAGQTIVFNPPQSKAFGEDDFTITDIGSNVFNTTSPIVGLNPTITVKASSSTVCSIDASKKVKIKAVGDCTLVANQEGGTASDGTVYAAAEEVEKTIEIKQATQTISFASDTPTAKFVGSNFKVNAESTSGLGVAIVASGDCSIDSSSNVTINAGTVCNLTATQAGDANYKAAAPVTHNIAVSTESISFPEISDKTVGDAPFNVTAKASSGATVTLTSSSPKVCTVKGSTVTLVAAGTCKLKATASGVTAAKQFKVKQSAQQIASTAIGKVITGTGSVTSAQLTAMGVTKLKAGKDYTSAIKAGTYADKNNPTKAELQIVIDKANADSVKSGGGSTSPLWLLMLGFVALFRRK